MERETLGSNRFEPYGKAGAQSGHGKLGVSFLFCGHSWHSWNGKTTHVGNTHVCLYHINIHEPITKPYRSIQYQQY